MAKQTELFQGFCKNYETSTLYITPLLKSNFEALRKCSNPRILRKKYLHAYFNKLMWDSTSQLPTGPVIKMKDLDK